MVDDFPSPANYTSSAAFNKTQTHAPSGLPRDEQKMAVEAMIEAVLLQGFCSGIFYCEARVCNSRVEYRDDPDVPFPVMYYKQPPPSQEPSILLREINARSPCIGSSTASLHSTGVDYFDLQAPAAGTSRGLDAVCCTVLTLPARARKLHLPGQRGGRRSGDAACGDGQSPQARSGCSHRHTRPMLFQTPSRRYGGKVGVVNVVHDRGGSLGPR